MGILDSPTTADNIIGATSVGKAVVKATNAAAAQTAIGATTTGKALLVAADAIAARQAVAPNGSAYFLREVEKYHISKADVVGVTNIKTLLDTCTAAAAADGVRHVVLPPGTLPIQGQTRIPVTQPMTIEGAGEDTVIQLNVSGGGFSKALLVAGGNSTAGFDDTKVALAGDLAAGSVTVTLPTAVASVLTVGATVGFECTTIVWGIGTGTQESRASEYRNVIAVSGTTVTLDGPLICDYLVSASATCYRVNLGYPLSFRNFRITSSDPTLYRQRSIWVEKCRDVNIENVILDNAGGGIYLNDVMRGQVNDCVVNKLQPLTDYRAYGVAVCGRSAEITVNNLHGRGMRHLFTTLSDERADTTQWGGPRNIIVSNGVGYAMADATGYAVWDTHPPGWDITFDNLQAFGGTGGGSVGIQVRSHHTKIVNPTVRNMSGAGINIQESATDCQIRGGEVGNCAGIGVAVGAPDVWVDRVSIHHNGTSGVYYDATGVNLQLTDNLIRENASYGIQCVGAADTGTGVVIKGNVIPKGTSGRQAISMLAPKKPATVIGNVLRDYGTGDTGIYTPQTGLAVTGNATD